MRKLWIFGLIAGLFALMAVPGALASNGKGKHKSNMFQLNVVHGIPGANVDVCARGDITGGEFAAVITEFMFTEIEVLRLPAGTYDVKVVGSVEKNSCDQAAIPGLEANGLSFNKKTNWSAVATLKNDGTLGFTLGQNDNSKLNRGDARVIAYHAAKAPNVNVLAAAREDKNLAIYGPFGVVFPDVAPMTSGAADVPANRYRLAIDAILGKDQTARVWKTRANLPEKKATIFYAIGDATPAEGQPNTFTVVSQKILTESHHKYHKKHSIWQTKFWKYWKSWTNDR